SHGYRHRCRVVLSSSPRPPDPPGSAHTRARPAPDSDPVPVFLTVRPLFSRYILSTSWRHLKRPETRITHPAQIPQSGTWSCYYSSLPPHSATTLQANSP